MQGITSQKNTLVIEIIKWRRLRTVGYVVRTHRREMCSQCWSKILKERDHPEDGCKWEVKISMDLQKVG